MPDPIGDFYRMVKGVENIFPIPAPTATVRVGSFDPATGIFEGLCSTTEWQPADREHLKPWKKTFPPSAQANGVNAILEFEILNPAPAGTRVTANGVTVRASPGQRVISIDVKNATRVDWKITSRYRSFHDRLLLTRPPIVGAGVFTLPALPVAIIYEPPPDRLRRNSAKYTANQTVGTTTRTTFSQEHSTATPGHSEFCSITDMTVSLQATANGTSARPPALSGAAEDHLGHSVSVGGDTALVGAHLAGVGGNSSQGAAYVFAVPHRVYLPLVLRNR